MEQVLEVEEDTTTNEKVEQRSPTSWFTERLWVRKYPDTSKVHSPILSPVFMQVWKKDLKLASSVVKEKRRQVHTNLQEAKN
jgi:3-methyladenine DNA glycosylase AlkC